MKAIYTNSIVVPAALLLDPKLSVPARALWVTARLEAGSACPAALEEATGFTKKTVRKALAELADRGWGQGPATGHGVTIPADLVTDGRVDLRAKLIYGVLQLTPAAGRFTYAELSRLARYSINTAKAAIGALVQTGWLEVEQTNRLHPVTFRLRRWPSARKGRWLRPGSALKKGPISARHSCGSS